MKIKGHGRSGRENGMSKGMGGGLKENNVDFRNASVAFNKSLLRATVCHGQNNISSRPLRSSPTSEKDTHPLKTAI